MKIKSLFFILAVVIVTACSKDLLDITFDVPLKSDMNVNIAKGAKANGTFDIKDTIILTDNEDITKYHANIKKWVVSGASGTFSTLSTNFKLIDCVINISSEGNVAEWTFQNLDIQEGTKVVFDNSNGQFDRVNLMLASKKPIYISFSGTTDQTGIDYKMALELLTKVTASPLN